MRFPGIIPAVTTPFTEGDTIDFGRLQDNVEALVRGGVHGLVATGTMGESASLELDEPSDFSRWDAERRRWDPRP